MIWKAAVRDRVEVWRLRRALDRRDRETLDPSSCDRRDVLGGCECGQRGRDERTRAERLELAQRFDHDLRFRRVAALELAEPAHEDRGDRIATRIVAVLA